MHDGGEGHLPVPLDLRHEGQAEVELLAVLQPHLPPLGVAEDLPVTLLLEVLMEREEENRPAEGGGGGVGGGSEHVQDGHHQLISVKVRVISFLLLYQEDVDIIFGIILIQHSLVFLYLTVDEGPQVLEDVEPLVVAGEGGEDVPDPGKHEGHQQDIRAEYVGKIVQQFLGKF